MWGFFALVTLFLMYLSPYLIEPLFFKFEPVQREGLEEEIRELMKKAGLQVSRVMQVDASRRSRHSNAYFTGIGRVKRIVLFDTLLDQMADREVLAVLAHEVGHWKKGHVRKRIFLTEVASLAFFYLAWRLLGWGGIPRSARSFLGFLLRPGGDSRLSRLPRRLSPGAPERLVLTASRVAGRPLCPASHRRPRGARLGPGQALPGKPLQPPSPSPLCLGLLFPSSGGEAGEGASKG